MPSLRVTPKSLKLKEADFEPQTLGEHLKKKRLRLELSQREAGKQLGVTLFTVINWEQGFRKPAIWHIPAIINFLGYDPETPTPTTLPEHLAARRREFGWTQRVAAQKLGVNPCTWSGWENGGTIMITAHRQLIARFLGIPDAEIHFTIRKKWNASHGRNAPSDC